ncbi:hypothetical protein [Duganella callida]|uniref:DUF5683 domain-containing protein n=1 Tax=Duganella callida TaxID=2561932 RepID=A0A4Y9SWB7_9BURK|nr:hypothetical protein [Duganella callida]TFW29649.1 hypothetical protein E4L98_03635 [Duganella callida]
MKASTKATLISALIFPGLGHLALKPPRGKRGLLFLLPAAVAVIYLINTVLTLSNQLLAELDSGALAFDPALIIERVHNSPAANSGMGDLMGLIFIVSWVGAIVDVLWLDRQR